SSGISCRTTALADTGCRGPPPPPLPSVAPLPQYFASSLLLRRPLGLLVAVQESLEPVALPLQTFDHVFRLARARQVVILPREDHKLRRHSEMLQCAEPLLALLQRDAVIVLR